MSVHAVIQVGFEALYSLFLDFLEELVAAVEKLFPLVHKLRTFLVEDILKAPTESNLQLNFLELVLFHDKLEL